ncbi:SAM-dependent methyltransferase [Rhodohalobacter sp.]|uniref:SAM-dependent methyltransferase n=1 Tax=Rhodohalobacter sp. TaxID=1974210 RepID=UPI002ACDA0CA|nr:SAM-dependent methyltransferase [Rhodohalobacter sp.]MDZ7756044.1 SAM-dependent methyltransferase [Rhodohalobacter sp.]
MVATPIGNLNDLSPRAAEVLNSVDYIACEDTRKSGHMLQHFGISKPTFSFHQHNEHRKVSHLMNILDANQNVALISDAGMPGNLRSGIFSCSRSSTRRSYRKRNSRFPMQQQRL